MAFNFYIQSANDNSFFPSQFQGSFAESIEHPVFLTVMTQPVAMVRVWCKTW